MTIKEALSRLIFKIKVYSRAGVFSIHKNIQKEIIQNFHRLYYDKGVLGGTWNDTKFLGVSTQKCPLDLFIYQEILFNIKPDLIIETGTAGGGGAYFLASICELMNHGEVVTVDINNIAVSPKHKRIKYLFGSSTSQNILSQIEKLVKENMKVMVILDSNHSKQHVLQELNLYSKFVSVGSYLIVEDTNVNNHPVYGEHGDGPMEAVEEFLKSNKQFKVDKSCEKHYLTFNPNGYLQRIV